MAVKRKIRKRSRLSTYFIGGFMILVAYAVFVALPIKYLPLPGFRTAGESLDGGWQWGNVDGCFDDVPVIQFVGKHAYLVEKGERVHRIFEDISAKADGDYYYLEGIANLPTKSSSSYPDSVRRIPFKIKYHDMGKILRVEEFSSNGEIADKKRGQYYSLVECGYPYLTNYILRFLGIRNFWRES